MLRSILQYFLKEIWLLWLSTIASIQYKRNGNSVFALSGIIIRTINY